MTAINIASVEKLHWKELSTECCSKCYSDLTLVSRASEINSLASFLYHSPVTRGYEVEACLVQIDHKGVWDVVYFDRRHHLVQVFFFGVL